MVSSLVEICGDGVNIGIKECDDGNMLDGDGCNSQCIVESGWSCHIEDAQDICIKNDPPVIKRASIDSNLTFKLIFSRSLDYGIGTNISRHTAKKYANYDEKI